MASIVLGLAASHSPLLILDGAEWSVRGEDDMSGRVPLNTLDGRYVRYAELKAMRGEPYKDIATPERFRQDSDAAERALDHLAAALAAAAPDVVVIVGDDQGELFDPANIPALCVFNGEEIVMRPWTSSKNSMPWAGEAFYRGYARDTTHRFPGAPALATDIVNRFIDDGIDVALSSSVPEPERHGFGHAIGFIVQRLFGGKRYPVVPVLLNTYYPPNTPTPRRCYAIGQSLRRAIEASPENARVAIIASGGLSHFLCEEELDRDIVRALRVHDADYLAGMDPKPLIAGSSEIRNWVLVAGAIPHLEWKWDEYIPVRRTPAGTGIGLGFMEWRS